MAETISLFLVALSGLFLVIVGVRADPALIRNPPERAVAVVLGSVTLTITALILMGAV